MRAKLKTLNDMVADNENLLDFVSVPESAAELSLTSLKLAILRRCGDVEPYEQNPVNFALFGQLWFDSHNFLFAHAIGIYNATYNPIENYDRTEEETSTDTRTGTSSDTDAHTGTDTTTGSSTTENDIAGFNSSAYSDADRQSVTSSEAVQHGETISRSGESTEDGERTRNLRVHGNIGVTTNQQMLEAEMELSRRFWIYDYIASAFETDNFITAYKSYWEGAQWNS